MKDKGSSAFDEVVSDKSTAKGTGEKKSGDKEGSGGKVSEVSQVEDVSDSVPVFPYADVEQHSVYMRGEAWEMLEDLKYYAEGKLREEYNVRNVETREFDEAMAKLLIDEIGAERLAERVVELRGFDSEN